MKKIFLLGTLFFLFLFSPFLVRAEKVQNPTNPLEYYEELFFVDIDAGANHNIALTEEGEVYTFGYNGYGQLGNGTSVNAPAPFNITANFALSEGEEIVDVRAGGNHTGALSSEHQLFLWGYNFYGQLGDSTIDIKNLPLNVTSFFPLNIDEYITGFALGNDNTIVLTNLGRVFTFGRNHCYQLGDQTAVDKNYPVDITPFFSLEVGEVVVRVEFDFDYAAALTNLGKIFLWGRNSDGQLGIGSLTYMNIPTNATAGFNLGVDEKIIDVELGFDHTLVITDQNRVFAFGENMYYQVGDGTSVDRKLPVYINNNLFSASLNKQYISIAAGYKDTMIVTSSGDVLTWGYGDYGQRGDGKTVTSVAKSNITINFDLMDDEFVVQGEMGFHHTLALTNKGRVFSFGRNIYGQLGHGNVTASYSMPLQIYSKANIVTITDNHLPIGENIVDVATGYLSSALVTETGKVFTWGYNDFGSLGNNNTDYYHESPVDITANFALAEGDKIIKVFAGSTSSSFAAISLLGRVFVWGYNSYGNLGDFTNLDVALPKDITANFILSIGDYVTQIAFGGTHTVALTNNGVVFTFGTNGEGELGNISFQAYNYPQNIMPFIALNPDEKIIKVDAGFFFSGALTNQGRLLMWGRGVEGQLGEPYNETPIIAPLERNMLLMLNPGEIIVDFALGNNHSLIATSENRLIGFGSSNYGQLATMSTTFASFPFDMTNNMFLVGDTIQSIHAGNGSTVVITGTNRIIAVGNSNSNLTVASLLFPLDITFAYNLGVSETINLYALSTLNAFLVTSENRLLATGRNDYYSIGNGLNTPLDNYTPIQINRMIADTGNILLVETPEVMYDNLLDVPVVIYPEFNVGPSLTSVTINGTVYEDFTYSDGRIFVNVAHTTAYDDTLNITVESFNYLNGSVSVSGNASSQTLFTLDTTPPTFDFIEDQQIEAGTPDIDWSTYITNPEDNSGGELTKIEVSDNVDYNSIGTYSVTVKLVDESLNETLQTFNVEVIDTTPPTFDYLSDFAIEAGSPDIDWTQYINNASDNSDGILTALEMSDGIDYNSVGMYQVTVKLVDESLNEYSQSFSVMVIDTTKPSFTFIEDITIELGSADIDWTDFIVNETDNSDGILTKVEVLDDVNYNQLGTYSVTVKLVDESSNEYSQSFEVTVLDTIAPTFDEIPDQTIEADINYVANWTALIQNEFDNSIDPLPRTVVEDNVISYLVGTYTVTVKLMDQSGNYTTQTFNVFVVDTTAPEMGFVNDQTLELGVSYDNDFWRSVVPSLYDNSFEEVTISINDSFVDYTQNGTYQMLILATDNYGNIMSQTIQVTIVDTTPPGFDYILTQIIEAGEFSDIDWTTKMFNLTDNSITPLTTVEVFDEVIYNKVGDYSVTVRLIDESLNETTQTFTVSVVDTISPNFSEIDNQVIEVGEFTDIDWTNLVENLEDNGFDELNIQEYDRINYGVVGSYVVTMVVSDISGNQLSRDFTVEVIDTTPPTSNSIEPLVIQAGDYINYVDLFTSVYDNSNDYVDIYIMNDGVDYFTTGTYQVEVRLMDLTGNFTLVYIDVEVIDTLSPYISYIEEQTFEAGEIRDFDWTTLMTGVYDNTLKEMEKYVISSSVNYYEAGQYEVVLGARDASMNEATITVIVNIIDTLAPEVYLLPAVDTVFIGDDYTDEGVLTVDATLLEILVEGTVDTNTIGTYMLTYTVTDSGGNTRVIKRIVTVVAKEEIIEFVLNPGIATIKKGDEYIDSGCMVYLNGTLYNEATILETDLDTNQNGIYYILYGYTYQDKTYTYKRIVFVVDELVNEPLVLVVWKEDEE